MTAATSCGVHATAAILLLGLLNLALAGGILACGSGLTGIARARALAAATAIGLTGVFGYAGSALSGVGTGHFVDRHGWGGGFAVRLPKGQGSPPKR